MKDKLPAKLRAVTLFLCCAVLTLLGGGARAEEEVETGARAAVLIERNTGMVLLCHNENEPLPMASTTKVMTALLALEKGNLDDVVTVGRNAYGVPGTSIYLNLGSTSPCATCSMACCSPAETTQRWPSPNISAAAWRHSAP